METIWSVCATHTDTSVMNCMWGGEDSCNNQIDKLYDRCKHLNTTASALCEKIDEQYESKHEGSGSTYVRFNYV